MELQEEISPLLHRRIQQTVQGRINFIRKNLFEINNLKTLHGTFYYFSVSLNRIKVKDTEEDLEVPLMSQLDDIYRKFHDQVGHPGINTTLLQFSKDTHGQGLAKMLENM